MTTDEAADPLRIRVSDRALVRAEASTLAAAPREIGGILVGWWEAEGDPVVRDLLTIPDRRASHTHYIRRHSAAQQLLDEYLRAGADANAGYIGEWHSHPAPQPPSSVDRATLGAIVRQARHPVALIVVALAPDGTFHSHGLIGRQKRLRRVAIQPALVERMSL